MDRHTAYIEKNWRETGLAHLVIWRARGDALADLGVFLVDCWCLGVKDVIYDEAVPVADCEEFVRAQLPEEFRTPIAPACAKKLIDGAIAFAERLGFSPHRDYRKGRRVLSGLDAAMCPEPFVFGRQGRPCYVPGADDDDQRIDRVLAILSARLGEDGFDYEPSEEGDAFEGDLAVRLKLRALLDEQPEDVPRFYAISGMVAAALVSPTPISAVALVEEIWGGDESARRDGAELREVLDLLMRYWNYSALIFAEALKPGAIAGADTVLIDVYEEDFEEVEDEETAGMAFIAASMEWAKGFMMAVELWPEMWGNALRRAELEPHWEILRLWSDITKGRGGLEAIAAAAREKPPRTLAGSVFALTRALRRPAKG